MEHLNFVTVLALFVILYIFFDVTMNNLPRWRDKKKKGKCKGKGGK
jgi:hypothetical protein